MKKLFVVWLWAALGVGACQKKTDQGGSPTGDTSGALSAPAAKSASPSATAEPTSASFQCPFPKRCTQACKDAFWKADKACKSESDAMINAMGKDVAEAYGKCNAACVAHQDQCIGSATAAECRCAEDCNKNLSADVKAKFDGYKRCAASVVAACE
jgi:hypothetical protein